MRITLMPIVCVAAAACYDSTQPEPMPVTPVNKTASVIIDPETNEWNQFDADVNISFYGQSAGVSTLPDPSRAVGYHVHRYQDPVGAWRSNFTHSNYRPQSNIAPGDMDPPRIGSAYGAGGSATPSLYDVNGAYVYLEQPSGEQPYGNGEYVPAGGASGPQVPPPPGGPYLRSSESAAAASPRTGSAGLLERRRTSGAQLSGVRQSGAALVGQGGSQEAAAALTSMKPGRGMGEPTKSRAWLEHYMVTPAAGKRIKDRLTAAAGPGIADGKGVKKFKIKRGKHGVEIDVDDEHGFVKEMRVTEDDKLQAITAREYEKDERGMHLLKKERITRMLPNGGSRLVEVEYKNMKLSKKEK